MEDSTLAANRNHCNFCHDRMAEWRKLRKLKVRILHWAYLHFSANPVRNMSCGIPAPNSDKQTPLLGTGYSKLLKDTESVFFSTPITPQFIHTHIIKIHCLYPPGFLSPKLPQKSMGGPALHPPSVPNLKAGLGQNAAVLALPARRAECERKARLELQTKLEARSCCSWMDPWDPWRIHGTKGKKLP